MTVHFYSEISDSEKVDRLFYGILWPNRKTVGINPKARFDPLIGNIELDLPIILEFASIFGEETWDRTHNVIGSYRNRIINPDNLTPFMIFRTNQEDASNVEFTHSEVNMKSIELTMDQFGVGYTPPIFPPQAAFEDLSFQGQYELYLYDLNNAEDRNMLEPIVRNIANIYRAYKESRFASIILELEIMSSEYRSDLGLVRENSQVTHNMMMNKFEELDREDNYLRKRSIPPIAGGKCE